MAASVDLDGSAAATAIKSRTVGREAAADRNLVVIAVRSDGYLITGGEG